ncbi:MAG: efflux RND transporter permease subunit, partial [Bacteroidota bacterium]|nr:efflux RND transporter permease subunit [Bacteroidota bacterium]
MSLSSLSIRRPVLSIVMSIIIVLFGIIGYTFLGVREYPSVDPPIITVSTNYTGANASVIETQITEPLEESINGIAGIRSLTSNSRDGNSNITVEFDLGQDLETAANDVRDRVSRAMRSLPPDVENPVVAKADADASPIVMLCVESDSRSLLEVTDYANNVFRERFQTIPGVSTVNVWGEKKYSMRLLMDPKKLAAFNLSPLDVKNALLKENVELPAGNIEGYNTELSIRTSGLMYTEEEFNNMIIKRDPSGVVKMRDIGVAKLAAENERSILRRNGVPMVGIVLIAQPGANNIEIANEFYKRLEQIKKDLPPDIKASIGFDITTFIRNSIKEVEETIFIAFGLVVLIIFLFLRDWRTTLIPVIAIPISLVGAFFIMYVSNFSINVLTLLGIVLAIGIVVDDAIVVLENIYAKIENKMDPFEASTKGSSEIFFAILSTTVTLATVFLPVIFLSGISGRLFREFGVVIAGSVIISAFVALTLTPMLSSKLLKRREHHNWLYEKTEPFFVKMNDIYKSSLESFLKRRWLGLVILSAAIILIVVIGKNLQSELAPLEDRSRLNISAISPEGTSYDYMDNFMSRLAQRVRDSVPENESVVAITAGGQGASGVNAGTVMILLIPREERIRKQQDIANSVSKDVLRMNDARIFVTQQQTIGASRGGLPVQFVLQSPSFEKLKDVLPKFIDEARRSPIFQVVDFNLKFNKPELRVEVDREKARSLGLSVMDIAETIASAFSGGRFGYFIMNSKQYQVLGQLDREDRNKPLDLKSLYVRNNQGELIQLDNVVTLTEQTTSPQLYRYNRYESATISAGLNPGFTIAQGIDEMNRIADKITDRSFSRALYGPSKDYAESSSSLVFAFLLALILIYLILAAQFESFRDPVIILLTVPLALAGAVISLFAFGHTLNIFSEIGMIMLIGLVTKNGILIVEFANQRKAAGLSRIDAIKDAAAQRLRPILMTSLATVLGT